MQKLFDHESSNDPRVKKRDLPVLENLLDFAIFSILSKKLIIFIKICTNTRLISSVPKNTFIQKIKEFLPKLGKPKIS